MDVIPEYIRSTPNDEEPKKGAIKLHVGLDADGHLPVFMDMTNGKEHEINWARTLKLPKGSFACFDRGFTDYGWYNDLALRDIFS